MTFNPKTDERLRLIQAQAGMRGFITIFVFNLVLMATRLLFFSENFPEIFDAVLLLSTMAGAAVFTMSLSKAGFYKTVRDENTRSRSSLRSVRLGIVAGTVLFGFFWFSIFSFLGTNSANLWTDVLSSALIAIAWGSGMWFWNARKMMSVEEE